MAAVRGQKVNVRVPTEPTLLVHVGPPLQPQGQFALAGLDADLFADGLVFEAAGDVHDDVSSRQPSLARPVDVGVGDLTEPHVSAHVDMPASEVRVDLVVVAVRLVGDALGGTEVDPAGNRSARVVVQHGYVDPVPSAVKQFEPRAGGLYDPFLLNFAPLSLRHLPAILFDGHGGRGGRGHFDIGRACLFVLPLAPALEGVVQEFLVGGFRQGERVGGHAAVDFHFHVERLVGSLAVESHLYRAPSLLDEGELVNVPQGDRGDYEARPAGYDFDRLDGRVRLRVFPCPQVVELQHPLCHLGLAAARFLPCPLASRWQTVLFVDYRPERTGRPTVNRPRDGDRRDLVPLAYRDALLATSRQTEYVVGRSDPELTSQRH